MSGKDADGEYRPADVRRMLEQIEDQPEKALKFTIRSSTRRYFIVKPSGEDYLLNMEPSGSNVGASSISQERVIEYVTEQPDPVGEPAQIVDVHDETWFDAEDFVDLAGKKGVGNRVMSR